MERIDQIWTELSVDGHLGLGLNHVRPYQISAIPGAPVQEVKKIDMAFQQLEDALTAYFNGRYHSAIVLAAASEQLFAGYMHLHGLEPSFTNLRKAIVKIANHLKSTSGTRYKATTEKDIGELLNRAYNLSHHAGKTELELLMNPKFEARETIDRAISNFDSVSSRYKQPLLPLAQRFVTESIEEVTHDADIKDVLSPVLQHSKA